MANDKQANKEQFDATLRRMADMKPMTAKELRDKLRAGREAKRKPARKA